MVGERSGQTGFVHCAHHHWWFGYAHYAADLADHPMVGKLGPNALDLSLEEARALLKGWRGAIKTFLLDQDRIVGIGNVYVQTPLWRAKIHPLRPIPSLSDAEIAALPSLTAGYDEPIQLAAELSWRTWVLWRDNTRATQHSGDRDSNSLGGTHVAIFHNVGDGEGPLQAFEAVLPFLLQKNTEIV